MHQVFLVDIVPPTMDARECSARMQELESLIGTFGGFVILKTIQKKMVPDYKTYIGRGKLEEIMSDMHQMGGDLLIIGNILKPRQLFEINERLRLLKPKKEIQARDKVDLILKIFQQHAGTAEAKLQIELAAIKHMGPRIFRMGLELSRQGGGGDGAMRGQGETNTEIMKRHLKEKERVIEEKIREYGLMRAQHRERRIRNNMFSVGIVGYTNAGKSSLLHALTGRDVLVENKLFATLGTTAARMFLWTNKDEGKGKDVLVHDTIGFMRDLPPQLIQAFTSTLEDSVQTDLLFHVIDASDPEIDRKIEIVTSILDTIGAVQQKIYVFTKIDLLDEKEQKKLQRKYRLLKPLFVSSFKKESLEQLKCVVLSYLRDT